MDATLLKRRQVKAPLEKWQSVKIERKIQKLLSKLLKISKGGATVSSKRLIDDISVVSYRHTLNSNFRFAVWYITPNSLEKSGVKKRRFDEDDWTGQIPLFPNSMSFDHPIKHFYFFKLNISFQVSRRCQIGNQCS